MSHKKVVLSLLCAVALSTTLQADKTEDDALATHSELGYIQTDGNTKTKTFNLDSTLKKGWGKNIFKLKLDAQYASDNDTETKNKYLIELNYNYEFSKRFAFDYLIGYKSDKFSSFDYQFYTGPGAQYKAIDAAKHTLALSGNILYAKDDFKDSDKSNSYAAYQAKGIYGWKITQSLKFDQELSFRGSFEESSNYFIFSKSAIISKISDIFSAGLSYKVDYVNEPGDKEKTDTTLTANLIIDY